MRISVVLSDASVPGGFDVWSIAVAFLSSTSCLPCYTTTMRRPFRPPPHRTAGMRVCVRRPSKPNFVALSMLSPSHPVHVYPADLASLDHLIQRRPLDGAMCILPRSTRAASEFSFLVSPLLKKNAHALLVRPNS